jgi:ribosome-associated translation inhibitor RaiA
MQIDVNTNHTIAKHQGLDEHVQSLVQANIGRFGEQVTRVAVHLSDENKEKHLDGGNRCTMEARVTGYHPVAVHGHAENLHLAVSNAADKLERAIDSALGRLRDKQKHALPPVEVDAEADENLTSES